MKKFLSLILCALLVVGTLVVPVAANGSVEDLMKEALGEAKADSKVDYVIEAPAYCAEGDEITVKVIVKNITAPNGIHLVDFKFNYDNEKLVLLNDLDEEDENVLICTELPNKWESMCSVANDYDPEAEEGTEVKPLNDGVIFINVCTTSTSKSNAVTADGQLVFEFQFKVTATGDLGFVIPNATASAAENTKDDMVDHAASGSYAITHTATVVKGKAATCTETGLTDGLACADCGEILVEQEVIPATGHDDGEWVVTKEATISEDGTKERHCTKCDHLLETAVIPKLFKLGDINNDQEINSRDYVFVRRYLLGTYTFDENQEKAADINGDGKIDSRDYVFIRRSILGTYVIKG